MFQLIWLLLCFPFYMLSIAIGIIIYIVYFCIKIISIVIGCLLKNGQGAKKYKKVIRKPKQLNTLKNNNNEYNDNIENYYEKLHYYDEKEKKNIVSYGKEYALSQVTDLELKITIEKIQELYNELGFKVKVIDITKKKYITEYEIIFSRDITQADILLVSNKIIEEFQIDGVKIVGNPKKENRIYIQIPLRYEETLT